MSKHFRPKMSQKTKKEDKIFSVALSIFELEEEHGHLGWKVTQIVESSGVSRSLIYRYFGSNKEEILLEALKAFVMRFYGFSGDSEGEARSFAERLKEARELLEDYPQAAMFYQKWRTSESTYQEEFLKIEDQYREALRSLYPDFNEDELTAFHVCLHGFVTAPFLKSELLENVWDAFLGMAKMGSAGEDDQP